MRRVRRRDHYRDEAAMLLSLTFLIALSVAAATSIAAWVFFEWFGRTRLRHGQPRRRRRRWLMRGAFAFVSLALTSAAILDGVNRHFAYIPSFAALRGNVSADLVRQPARLAKGQDAAPTRATKPTHGVVQEVDVAGSVSGVEPRKSYVYLPPEYFDPTTPGRRFPVLYLIHGSPGVSQDWLRGGNVDRVMDDLLADRRIQPFIVMLPDVNGGYLRDVECQDIPNGMQAETYVVRDVVDWVDNHYRTIADRKDRAIGGLSTGGYCGINILFKHQDRFSAAVSHSGYGKPDRNIYTRDLFRGDMARLRANTPDMYLPTIPITATSMGVYLDAGGSDVASRRESERLAIVLHRRGVETALNIVKGESHSFTAFRNNLSLSLPWVSHWFYGALISVATASGADALP
jgi:enterochelin esterase-like enzyme